MSIPPIETTETTETLEKKWKRFSWTMKETNVSSTVPGITTNQSVILSMKGAKTNLGKNIEEKRKRFTKSGYIKRGELLTEEPKIQTNLERVSTELPEDPDPMRSSVHEYFDKAGKQIGQELTPEEKKLVYGTEETTQAAMEKIRSLTKKSFSFDTVPPGSFTDEYKGKKLVRTTSVKKIVEVFENKNPQKVLIKSNSFDSKYNAPPYNAPPEKKLLPARSFEVLSDDKKAIGLQPIEEEQKEIQPSDPHKEMQKGVSEKPILERTYTPLPGWINTSGKQKETIEEEQSASQELKEESKNKETTKVGDPSPSSEKIKPTLERTNSGKPVLKRSITPRKNAATEEEKKELERKLTPREKEDYARKLSQAMETSSSKTSSRKVSIEIEEEKSLDKSSNDQNDSKVKTDSSKKKSHRRSNIQQPIPGPHTERKIDPWILENDPGLALYLKSGKEHLLYNETPPGSPKERKKKKGWFKRLFSS